MTKKQIINALKAKEKAIAKERDALRELEYELEDLVGNADTALNDLRCCIDQLSETL